MLVKESRALFGAIALIITGAILSSMSHQYFAGQYTGEAIVRSRSWWEIVLNLQVLCLAFMWFCYADRVRTHDKRRARVMKLRMFFGLLAVLVPFFIALTAVYFGWFEERPTIRIVDLIVCYMLIFWAFSASFPKALALKAKYPELRFVQLLKYAKPRSVLSVFPAVVGVLVIAFDAIGTSRDYYFLLPILFYLQAAMPFLYRAFSLSRPVVAAE